MLYDPDTGQRILNPNACLMLVSVSAEARDDNGDGQIDFLDIPVGEHMIEVTRLPDGDTTVFAEHSIPVEPGAPYSIVSGIVAFVEAPRVVDRAWCSNAEALGFQAEGERSL